jgi:hypothetical protein
VNIKFKFEVGDAVVKPFVERERIGFRDYRIINNAPGWAESRYTTQSPESIGIIVKQVKSVLSIDGSYHILFGEIVVHCSISHAHAYFEKVQYDEV